MHLRMFSLDRIKCFIQHSLDSLKKNVTANTEKWKKFVNFVKLKYLYFTKWTYLWAADKHN